MRSIKSFFAWVFLLACAFNFVLAQTPVAVQSGERQFIGKNIEFFIDTTNKLGITEVLGKKFEPGPTEILNFGNTLNPVWMRFSVESKTEMGVFLEVLAPLLNEIELYQTDSGVVKTIFKGSCLKPFAERPIRSENWLFNLQLKAGEKHNFYLKGRSDFPMQVPISISEKTRYVADLQSHNLFWGIYLGVMVFAFIYNLFIYFSVRERIYLYYLIYILTSVAFYLGLEGMGFQFLWPASGGFNNYIAIFICISNLMIILFAFKFLNISKKQKVSRYWGLTMMGIFILIPIVNLTGNVPAALGLAQLMSIVGCLFYIYAGVSALLRKEPTAKYFLLSWSAFLVLCIIFILTLNNAITSNFFTTHCLFMGHMSEVLLLSFALADRINLLKKENADKSKEIIRSLEANEKIQIKMNRELEQKVVERTAMIEQQKQLIEEKHKEITDSINYAERIQRALLASKQLLDENLKEYFVLYKPKDVVSGDFYWACKLGNGNFVLVTADSTGHGVPGAIMSIVNMASLREAVTQGIARPDLLLNETRSLVIESLKNDGSAEGGKDGMDASLLSFDFKTDVLSLSCANNAVWIIRGNQLTEISGDHMPVGKHEKDQLPFTLHTFNLQKGDVVYTLTDGFTDQFGGVNGKKFKKKQLQNFLLTIKDEPMKTQKRKLIDVFDQWKGGLEQVDDVLIAGMRY
jgi:serine phosphatase RsbU (regulator of sigma subunit)